MTVATDAFRQKLIVDGGVAVDDDVNFAQRFLGARIFDQILARCAPAYTAAQDALLLGAAGAPATGPLAYALVGGAGYPKQGSTGNAYVMFTAGTIFQKIAADSGLEEKMLPFTFDGTTSSEVGPFANGDVSNPRIDIVQMKLELIEGDAASIAYDVGTPPTVTITSSSQNTTRRVRCTLAIKQGTPAASPTIPDPDSGYVAAAMVYVPTAYAWASPLAIEHTTATPCLFDLRMPLGVHAETVRPRDGLFTDGSYTFPQGQHYATVNSGGGPSFTVPCPVGGQCERLLGVAVSINEPSQLQTRIGQLAQGGVGGSNGTFRKSHNLTGNIGGSGAVGSMSRRQVVVTQGAITHDPAFGPVIVASAGGINVPLWSNGKHAIGTEVDSSAPVTHKCIGLQWTSLPNATELGQVTFYLARGL